MTYALVLLVPVVALLVAFALGAVIAHRRAHDVALLVALGLTAYWTLVGAVQILVTKAVHPASRATYLEDRLFRIDADGTYATALVAYSFFLVGTLVLAIVLVRERSSAEIERSNRQATDLAATIRVERVLAVIAVLFVAKVAVLVSITRGHAIGDLYELTRTAGGDRRITLYEYLNVATAYPLACVAALLLGAGRHAQGRARVARHLTFGFLAGVLVENAILGNRAVPLICLAGVAVAWVRWRFLPAAPSERRRLGARFVAASAAGLVLVGLIGAIRSDGATSPGRLVDAVGSVTNSSEKVAAHMSLDGVLQLDHVRLDPLTSDSYGHYADLVGAPPDQVFTLHYVTAWWVRIGAVGVVAAALSYGGALVLLQRLSTADVTPWRAPFVLAAGTLLAAGLPVTLLRSGPESLRAVAVELVLIPGLVLAPGFVGFLRRTRPETVAR